MRRHFNKLIVIGGILVLTVAGGSAAFALPSIAKAHAQAVVNKANTNSNSNKSTTNAGQANSQARLMVAKLKVCQNREKTISNIMARIRTRAQNQITLFSGIATRVENFYTKQGKTLSNYNQLVAAVDTAKATASANFNIMSAHGSFSCGANDPKGTVTAFQGYLKTEINDLQNYRTSVKNLIVGVASANGTTVSDSSTSST